MRFAKPIWLNSLSLKVLLAYVVGVVLSILLISFFIFWLMIHQSNRFAADDVTQLTQDLSKHIEFDQQGRPVSFGPVMAQFSWMFDSMRREVAFRILDEAGQSVLVSDAGDDFWRESGPARIKKFGAFRFENQGVSLQATTIIINRDGQPWYFQFAVSERLHYLLHQVIGLQFMGAGIITFSLVLLVVFGICGFITLTYTLKPLRKVSESAATISPRSIHARLNDEKVPYEIAPLVQSFNRVLDRLEHGYRVQQEFLATAAHELKTPLALIRAQIEVKEKSDDRDLLLNDVAHMTRQVQQLLLLAEVSEEQNYTLVSLDVAEVINEVVAYLQPMAKTAKVQITIAHILEAHWQADRSALFVLLKNLLENAIQHAPPNSDINIDITANEVSIRDWGPGMEEEHLPNIFTRFWRGAHRRDHGAGLGMTICKEIAQAHNWTLSAHRAEPGLCFKLMRPTSDSFASG